MAERPNLISDTYDYLAKVPAKDGDEFSVVHPSVDSITLMKGIGPKRKIPYQAARLKYKLSARIIESRPEIVEDRVGPYALFVFDEDGDESFLFVNPLLESATDWIPESGERITLSSYGFLVTVFQALHQTHPHVFGDPDPIWHKVMESV